MVDEDDMRSAVGEEVLDELDEYVRELPRAIEAAEEAFWAVIAEKFPELPGDVAPEWVMRRDRHNAEDVLLFIYGNMPLKVEVSARDLALVLTDQVPPQRETQQARARLKQALGRQT